MGELVFCPKIADPDYVLTSYNLDALTLTTYDTSPGTNVSISCLSGRTHRLNGSKFVTCLENGQWDTELPTCIAKTPYSPGDPIHSDGSTTESPMIFGTTSYEMLPYLVGLAILAVTCIILVILFTFAVRRRRHSKDSNGSIVYDNSSGSWIAAYSDRDRHSPSRSNVETMRDKTPVDCWSNVETMRTTASSPQEVSPFWIDLATPHNFRCHELANSRDRMVENLRYTQLSPNWSGY